MKSSNAPRVSVLYLLFVARLVRSDFKYLAIGNLIGGPSQISSHTIDNRGSLSSIYSSSTVESVADEQFDSKSSSYGRSLLYSKSGFIFIFGIIFYFLLKIFLPPLILINFTIFRRNFLRNY